ncbi:MAG: tRNA uridine(34) 5-carboxymethylaminomethyl modification radical SAM/GNAT enzyme Elp3 [Desulfurococcaceae archaeon]
MRANVNKPMIGIKRPTRALSGVTVVAVMTKPYPCPHGKCIYCPGGIEYNTPQSYIGNEPALNRARLVNYDPYDQVYMRLKQYEINGHVPNKAEVIVMGGTFTALPIDYQIWFITNIFEAFNNYPGNKPETLPSLEEAQLRNETSNIRVVGLTLETRPDWAKEKQINLMLYLGATKVEIGVQSIYDDVLRFIKRGHTVKDVVESTRLLKDAGYKVTYHIMPGLPGSDPDRDLEMIKELFKNPDFRPDMLKIYPTLVIEGTELYELWKKGLYRPLTDEEAVDLISEMYRFIPKWVRVMRIQRDIPAQLIVAGPRKSNLRELVEKVALEKGIEINEIRFREVGRQEFYRGVRPSRITITKEYYEASNGIEIFIAAEDISNNIIVGLLRLRIPSDRAHRPEVDNRTAIVRELHVYGLQTPVGMRLEMSWQHQGWGKELLRVAEELAKHEFSCHKILVLSGVGAREYYRKMGYTRPSNSPYMVKLL